MNDKVSLLHLQTMISSGNFFRNSSNYHFNLKCFKFQNKISKFICRKKMSSLLQNNMKTELKSNRSLFSHLEMNSLRLDSSFHWFVRVDCESVVLFDPMVWLRPMIHLWDNRVLLVFHLIWFIQKESEKNYRLISLLNNGNLTGELVCMFTRWLIFAKVRVTEMFQLFGTRCNFAGIYLTKFICSFCNSVDCSGILFILVGQVALMFVQIVVKCLHLTIWCKNITFRWNGCQMHINMFETTFHRQSTIDSGAFKCAACQFHCLLCNMFERKLFGFVIIR